MPPRGKQYTDAKKEECFLLYSQGVPFYEIAKKFGNKPQRQTIKNWSVEGRWEERRKVILAKKEQILDETATDITVRQHKIIKALLGKALPMTLKKLEEEGANVGDIKKLLEHELLLEGKPTERLNVGVDANWEEVMKLAKK